MRLRAGWLLGPGYPGTSRVFNVTFYLLVMCFGVCRSRYGIRIGLVRAKLNML